MYQLLLRVGGRDRHTPVEPHLCSTRGSLQEVPYVSAPCQSEANVCIQ